jgi:alpha-tubulin suppressor-like RCC1 family protein
VVTGFDLASIDGGAYVTCGLTSLGTAYCWGNNFSGQLGNAATGASELLPVAVAPPSGSTTPLEYGAIDVGYGHVCALAKGGQVFCWGSNEYGQLGTGTGGSGMLESVPTPVVGSYLFTSVSVGSSHTCALDKGGLAYCWGINYAGQLGTGTLGPETCANAIECSTVPLAVAPPVGAANPLAFSSISPGSGFTCGVAKGGQLFCWGDNANGQLGIGTVADGTDKLEPTPAASGLRFTAVSAGADHACALAKGGALYCWGKNEFGEVGNGTTEVVSAPVAVIGGLTFTDVSAGLAYDGGETRTCAIAKGGKAYCWGDNAGGRLGAGVSGGIRAEPTAVAGGHIFTAVTTGMIQSCGVTRANGAYCWGSNFEGELGVGSLTSYMAPVPVGSPAP